LKDSSQIIETLMIRDNSAAVSLLPSLDLRVAEPPCWELRVKIPSAPRCQMFIMALKNANPPSISGQEI
jgi:hypothetical protein